jgi:hypothetical protein
VTVVLPSSACPRAGQVAAAPVGLLLAATLGLLALRAAPRAGEPVLLLFPAGTTETAALVALLAVPGWDPAALRRVGPFPAVVAAPARAAASAGELRRRSGAWLALAGLGWRACDGGLPNPDGGIMP